MKVQTLFMLFILSFSMISICSADIASDFKYHQEITFDSNFERLNVTQEFTISKQNGMKSDFTDIRFVNTETFAEYPYYIKEYNGTQASVLIRIPTVSLNNSMTMCWGNETATDMSNEESAYLYYFNNSIGQNISSYMYYMIPSNKYSNIDISFQYYNISGGATYTIFYPYPVYSIQGTTTGELIYRVGSLVDPATPSNMVNNSSHKIQLNMSLDEQNETAKRDVCSIKVFDVNNGNIIFENTTSSGYFNRTLFGGLTADGDNGIIQLYDMRAYNTTEITNIQFKPIQPIDDLKTPIEIFGFGLIVLFSFGVFVFYKSIFYSHRPLNKADIYIRGTIFLISLILTLMSSVGVYIGSDEVGYILGIDEYWIIIPFTIAVVSLFATVYAWLSVFGKKKKEEI